MLPHRAGSPSASLQLDGCPVDETGRQRRPAAVAHSPAAPLSRPGPWSPLYTFLHGRAAEPARVMEPIVHFSAWPRR